MKTNTAASILYIPLFAAAWFLLEYILVGSLALAYVPLFTGGFLLWWFTTRKTPIEPQAVIIPYLLTVIAFIAHVFEEYKTYLLGFPDISPLTATFEQMVIFAATLAPILWLLGGVMMLKRWSVGYFIASTFLFGMMFIEPTHFLTPFMRGGAPRYVQGLWTAILPITLGWYTFFAIRREIKRKETYDS